MEILESVFMTPEEEVISHGFDGSSIPSLSGRWTPLLHHAITSLAGPKTQWYGMQPLYEYVPLKINFVPCKPHGPYDFREMNNERLWLHWFNSNLHERIIAHDIVAGTEVLTLFTSLSPSFFGFYMPYLSIILGPENKYQIDMGDYHKSVPAALKHHAHLTALVEKTYDQYFGNGSI